MELNKSQIDYILKNKDKKSHRRIARDLGIDKDLVDRYLRRPDKPLPAARKTPVLSAASWTAIHVIFIFAAALAIRLIYINQLSRTYFFAPFKGGLDDYIFDNWAQEILRGNWLGDRAIYIYRMPLYVYFLSAVYFIFGHSYHAIYIIQSFMGAVTCVTVYFISRMIYTRSAALAAALLTAFYGPFLFYSGMVVGETLTVLLTCLGLLLLLVFQKRQKPYLLLIAGLTIGLSMLARGNMLIVLPFIILWLISLFRPAGTVRLAGYVLMLAAGVLIAVSPVLARNYIAEKDIVPITALGGLNFYIGNAYGADGRYRNPERISGNAEDMIKNSIGVAEEAMGRKLKPSEVSNYWISQALKSIRAHGAGPFFSLLGKKTVLFWNSYELPDIWDYYFFKKYIPLLNTPLPGFIVIAPLGVIGLFLSWPRRREASLLYVFIAGYMVSLITFFITSRYRLQAVPFLAIFAGYAIAQAKGLLKDSGGKLFTCVIILIAALVFSSLPVKKIDFEVSFNSLGILLKRSGRIDDAINTYKKAIEISPDYPTPYYNLGILYRDRGLIDTAAGYFRKAIEIDPDFARARKELKAIEGGDE